MSDIRYPGFEAAPADSSFATEWQTDVVRNETALAALGPEWDDLYGRCSTATAFVSSAWLLSWWRNYGQPGRLVSVLVRRDGRLVAAAALMRCRRFRIPVLTSLGVGISDFTDILLDDSCAPEAARHLVGGLTSLGRWRAIDLPEVPGSSATAHLVDAWPYRTWAVPASVCLELPAQSIHELIATLPATTAHGRRKKQRRIDRQGISTRLVTGDAAAESAMVLLRLHQQQWLGRGMNPEHGRSRFAEHLTAAVPAMVDRGQAHLVEYQHDNEIVAVELLLGGHRQLCAYLYGLRPDLRQRIDVTQLLVGTNLEMTQRLGASTLNLLRGDEPSKQRWRPRETRNRRVLLAAERGFPAAALATAGRLRERCRHIVKTRLPGLRTIRRRLRACRPSGT